MSEPTGNPDPMPDRVLDAGAMRALAHPIRIEIYDILSQYGPQTASSLAAMTGESTGSTSYHLRALARHDLIREAPDRGTARERWWERPRGAVTIELPYAFATPSARAASQMVNLQFLQRRHQQLMDAVSRISADGPSEGGESDMIRTTTLRLTPEQQKEFGTRLDALIQETVEMYRDQTGDGVRLVSLHTDLFPLPPNAR